LSNRGNRPYLNILEFVVVVVVDDDVDDECFERVVQVVQDYVDDWLITSSIYAQSYP
jgi:hypothetical protein